MANTGWVVLDTNVFGLIGREIDPSFTVIDLIVSIFGDKGIAAHRQLTDMRGFEHIRGAIEDLPNMDEKVAVFLMEYQGKVDLQKVHSDDPTDLCFIVFSLENSGATLVTCERALLQIAHEQNISRACVKAAVHRLDNECGGIFGEKEYNTKAMFNPAGNNPFLHYQKSNRCFLCDPHKVCGTHKNPPSPPPVLN